MPWLSCLVCAASTVFYTDANPRRWWGEPAAGLEEDLRRFMLCSAVLVLSGGTVATGLAERVIGTYWRGKTRDEPDKIKLAALFCLQMSASKRAVD